LVEDNHNRCLVWRGVNYSNACIYCGSPLQQSALLLAGTGLSFCGDSCVVSFISEYSVLVNIKEEDDPQNERSAKGNVSGNLH